MADARPDPECAGCKSLAAALLAALRLLDGVNSDANNVQLDIARFQRRHHAALAVAGAETSS